MTGGGPRGPSALARFDHLPTLVAALLCLQGLWRWPLWEDELFTWGVATELPFAQVFELAAQDRHPPLYFLLTALVARMGTSDAVLRLPSAVAAVLTVALVVHLGRRHLGVGALGAWLLPLLPFFLVYGTMARSYALLLVLGGALLAASFLPLRKAAVAVAVLGAIAIHTHYAMALPIVAALGALALRGWMEAEPGRRLHALVPAVGAAVAIGVCFVPWGIAAAGQAARESVQGVRYSVLGWALWPVARFVPYVAWPMLALALLGAGWALVGARGSVRLVLIPWIVAAVVLPLLASTRGATAIKLYVFAPLLPLFVLLAAVGLTRTTARLATQVGPLRDLLLAAPLLLLTLPDTFTMLSLPAMPLELNFVTSGSRDVRRDATIFAEVDPTLFDRALDDRSWTPYARYLPRPVPGPHRMRAWYGWRRAEGAEAKALSEGVPDRGCFFRRAFLSLVYMADPSMCMSLRLLVAAEAERDGYGPFVMQAAEFARDGGDTATAEQLAREAVGRLGPSSEASVFLARMQLDRGDAAAAATTARAALPLAKRWGDNVRVAELYELAGVASDRSGNTDQAAAARTAMTCARSAVPLMLCGTWAESLWPAQTFVNPQPPRR